MDTLLKALLWTCLLVILIIGLPILVLIIGVAWPVLLTIAILIFVPIAFGILIGKNSKGKED